MHIFLEKNLVIKEFFFFETLKNVHKVDKYVDNSVYIIFVLVLKRNALYNLYNDFFVFSNVFRPRLEFCRK